MKTAGQISIILSLVFFVICLIPNPPMGGNFALVDQNGKLFQEQSLHGQYALVFFGYTDCPGTCPLTLSKISQALTELHKDGISVATVFITVDPTHDGPDELKAFLTHFYPGIIGLTGTKSQIAHVENLYHVRTETVDGMQQHSSYIYLLGKDGHYLMRFELNDSVESIAKITKGYAHAS